MIKLIVHYRDHDVSLIQTWSGGHILNIDDYDDGYDVDDDFDVNYDDDVDDNMLMNCDNFGC